MSVSSHRLTSIPLGPKRRGHYFRDIKVPFGIHAGTLAVSVCVCVDVWCSVCAAVHIEGKRDDITILEKGS